MPTKRAKPKKTKKIGGLGLERLTWESATQMLRDEKEIVCLDSKALVLFTSLALSLLTEGRYIGKLAKVTKGY